jgi:hypothetical protein
MSVEQKEEVSTETMVKMAKRAFEGDTNIGAQLSLFI